MNRSRLRRILCRDAVEWENLQFDVGPDHTLTVVYC